MITLNYGSKGGYFKFGIHNYQFQLNQALDRYLEEGGDKNLDDDFIETLVEDDNNWLVIKFIHSEDGKSECEYKDPCMLTSEWNDMVSGFENVYKEIDTKYVGIFLEQCFGINIEKVNKVYEISYVFESKSSNIDDKIYISKDELLKCIFEMKSYSEKFPKRYYKDEIH